MYEMRYVTYVFVAPVRITIDGTEGAPARETPAHARIGRYPAASPIIAGSAIRSSAGFRTSGVASLLTGNQAGIAMRAGMAEREALERPCRPRRLRARARGGHRRRGTSRSTRPVSSRCRADSYACGRLTHTRAVVTSPSAAACAGREPRAIEEGRGRRQWDATERALGGASCAAGISPRTCASLGGRPRPHLA